MTRKVLSVLTLLVGMASLMSGQHYPPEWVKYTYDNYLYAVEKEVNNDRLSETAFKDKLLKTAHANLAKQIEIRVVDEASIEKKSIDEMASVRYVSETRYSTDVTLNLVENKTYYDVSTRQGYAIAFIDKNAALRFWLNEFNVSIGKLQNAMAVAEVYVETGFKDRAVAELTKGKELLPEIDEALSWMAIFDVNSLELAELMSRRNILNQSVKQKLSDLEYGVTICVDCSADVFGTQYPSLDGDVKSALAKDGCNFSDDYGSSDWLVKIVGASREHNAMAAGNQTLYFVYVDVLIKIEKKITGQLIYEDMLSVKGSHGAGYGEAARNAYRKITPDVCEIIVNNINNQ